jgi:nanoRNase/pAp phosphatase (c-di-AMP/oligoRNAs hydrolase)
MRVVTRSDFDGLGCAVLLKEAGVMDDISFVHPKDIQDGKIEVNKNDVLANIPYVPGCGLWFDHHTSESERAAHREFAGAWDPEAPSAARVIYRYYGGEKRFPGKVFADLVEAVDKADSARFTAEEVLDPKGWVLLSFVMDPRTGLGRYKDYRIGNYQLMMDLVNYCGKMPVEEILEVPDVKERVVRYFEQDKLFREMVEANTTVRGNVTVFDLRNQEEIYTGNRFIPYVMYPDQNVSVQVMWGFRKQNIVMTAGHSITNRTCRTDVGSLMLRHGGGGHARVGTCQVPVEEAERVLEEIVLELNRNG